MDVEPANVSRSSPRDELAALVPSVWVDDGKGLRKELISFSYKSMKKPSELSRCLVKIGDVSDLGTRESNFLKPDEPGNEQWISMGSSVTPIDYYVEQIIAQMLTNERSRCTISCKSGSVSFVLELLRIEDNEYYFTRSSAQMLTFAKQYKENGVKCFGKYPLLAHQYFNRAAKCLLSFAPLEYLDPAIEGADTIASMQSLLETLNLNIAACLLKQNRFDDALHMLEYVDRQNNPSPKAIYRKALAQFHVKQYTEAVKTLQRIDYAANKECSTLYANIVTNLEKEKEKYNSMVRKMFG